MHGVGGTWGALATSLFASKAVNQAGSDGLFFGNPGQMTSQIIAIVASYAIAIVGTYVILKVISLFTQLRASDDEQEIGMDLTQHGEDAYTDFVSGSSMVWVGESLWPSSAAGVANRRGTVNGLEETTIVDVATTINAFVITQATWHLDGPVHVRWGITTARETLAVAGHCAMAIEANTNLMLGNQYYTLAGPCTVMCLLETAAQAITDTASGREVLSGVAAAKGVATNFTTGLEARMMQKLRGLWPVWRQPRLTRS